MPDAGNAAVVIRRATPADRGDIIALLAESLGWQSDEEYRRLFAWKHDANPFGPSPAWVAADGDRLVGFRTMLRWEFCLDGAPVSAVRAVDTATHPEYQGRGIFSRLTTQALEDLGEEDASFVFNTPNAQSQRGYLKMGWQVVGRVPLAFRPRTIRSAMRTARARKPADRWSIDTPVGRPAHEALADQASLGRLLASQPIERGLTTQRTARFFLWRYGGFPRLAYRVLTPSPLFDDGFVVFRLRRRGAAIEAVVADELAPDGNPRTLRSLLRALPSLTGADYAIRSRPSGIGGGFIPLPHQGPTLTCRPLGSFLAPALSEWRLSVGDVELF